MTPSHADLQKSPCLDSATQRTRLSFILTLTATDHLRNFHSSHVFEHILADRFREAYPEAELLAVSEPNVQLRLSFSVDGRTPLPRDSWVWRAETIDDFWQLLSREVSREEFNDGFFEVASEVLMSSLADDEVLMNALSAQQLYPSQTPFGLLQMTFTNFRDYTKKLQQVNKFRLQQPPAEELSVPNYSAALESTNSGEAYVMTVIGETLETRYKARLASCYVAAVLPSMILSLNVLNTIPGAQYSIIEPIDNTLAIRTDRLSADQRTQCLWSAGVPLLLSDTILPYGVLNAHWRFPELKEPTKLRDISADAENTTGQGHSTVFGQKHLR